MSAAHRVSDTGGRLMLEPDAARLLEVHGIPCPDSRLAASAEEAAVCAAELGYPVVLKIVSGDIAHKSDVGGVVLGLESDEEVRLAAAQIASAAVASAPGARIAGFLVSRQIAAGTEMIIGALRDPVCGPVVMCGQGGVLAELFDDVSFRLAPIEATEAEAMLRELKGWPLLNGFRGRPRADVSSVTRLLVSASRMICHEDSILELDLNPVIVGVEGAVAVDAHIVVRRESGSQDASSCLSATRIGGRSIE